MQPAHRQKRSAQYQPSRQRGSDQCPTCRGARNHSAIMAKDR
jgi:hypothetical protein